MIRNAIAADSLRIIELVQEALRKSVYADRCGVDVRHSRDFFARCAMVQGQTGQGATFYRVCEVEGVIEGYFLGVLDRVYQMSDKLSATDVHIYISPRANPRDGLAMINDFIEWARGNKHVIEIVIGGTALFGEMDERLAELLKRKGFVEWGRMFKLRIEK